MRISDWSSDVCSSDLLDDLGHSTTLSYLREMAALVFEETGLLPHLNPGLMDEGDYAALRPVSASMGLMLGRRAGILAAGRAAAASVRRAVARSDPQHVRRHRVRPDFIPAYRARRAGAEVDRSEEHTSELKYLMRISYAV